MVFVIPDSAVEWLRTGERGLSSEAIFVQMTGLPICTETWTPSDPSDVRRCRLLLEAVPEFAARLCQLMDEECPDWRDPRCDGRAPKTFALINEVRQ